MKHKVLVCSADTENTLAVIRQRKDLTYKACEKYGIEAQRIQNRGVCDSSVYEIMRLQNEDTNYR